MKKLNLPCDCVGGAKYCATLQIFPYKGNDKDAEISIIGNDNCLVKKGKKRMLSIYLNKKSLEKLKMKLK